MADQLIRFMNVIEVDANGNPVPDTTPIVFSATDLGDGTYQLTVGATSIPAPTNFALETGGNLALSKADLDSIVDALVNQQTVAPVADPTLAANLHQRLAQIEQLLAWGLSVALSSPPANLTASAETQLTFASKIHHLLAQNNSSTSCGVEFDTPAATAGSLQIAPGQTLVFDIPVTVLRCYSAAATPVNGAAAGNLIVKGWA